MKRINQYKKLFNVESTIDLAELKKTYRSLVKEWHPDKFQEDDEKALEAETMSRDITQGYECLISIAPATIENNLEEYKHIMEYRKSTRLNSSHVRISYAISCSK